MTLLVSALADPRRFPNSEDGGWDGRLGSAKVEEMGKRGPRNFAERSIKPKGAGLKARMQIRKNQKFSVHSMRAFRGGFRLMWRLSKKYMKRIGVKEPGKYSKNNGHDGVMWGLPKECKLKGVQAATVFEKCKENGATKDQLRTVRKSLSYAFLLRTGTDGDNFEEVKQMWNSFDLTKMAEPQKSLLPERVPTPKELRVAFTTPWTTQSGMSFIEWTVGLLAAWDVFVLGNRPGVDIKKIKKSAQHTWDDSDGYCATVLVGGKSKLCGNKRGTRPWLAYRVCLCNRDGQHKPPTQEFTESIGKDGNPVLMPDHDSSCPVSALEVLQKMQFKFSEFRVYRKWTPKSGFVKSNFGDVVQMANKFFRAQGVLKEGEFFMGNSGRKALAEWTKELRVPFKESFEIHGDLEKVWSKYYEGKTRRGERNEERSQSGDKDVCCAALRRFARFCKRGMSVKRKLTVNEKLMVAVLKGLNQGEVAERILAEGDD